MARSRSHGAEAARGEVTATASLPLPARWYPLRPHAEQWRLFTSTARFDVIEAGRRSGKTELIKRIAVLEAERECRMRRHPWITKLCAPTREQAKTIFWEDIKSLSALWWSRDPQETELRVFLRGGGEIWICGLDKPQRIEGSPINRLGVDELADVKPGAWERHLRPALDTEWANGMPPARAWLFGVPRPGSQFAELARLALDPTKPDFAYHHWTAESILSPEKIAAAKAELDPLTYAQEYLAKRVNYQGLAYYCWSPQHHYRQLRIDPQLPLVLALDFNVEPGVAAIIQEQFHRHGEEKEDAATTCVVDEVHIPRNSRTEHVIRKFLERHRGHKGDVHVHGDATGGARDTASEHTDWEIVRKLLRPVFGDRMRWRVPRSNPAERDRVNTMNWRLRNTAGQVRFLIDPNMAPKTVRDFEGVMLLQGGSGEIDKKAAERQGMSHLSDAVSYYVHAAHPMQSRGIVEF